MATEDPSRAAARPETDRLIVGILVAHGRAPYEGSPSYFVRLQTTRGERTIWSAGLERAFRKSETQPQIGEPVGLRENGSNPLVVEHFKRVQGKRVLVRRIEAPQRPHWVVERREWFDERLAAAATLRDPRISARDAVREHPELTGAYSVLIRVMEVGASRLRLPVHRLRFAALVREAFARTAEIGEPLPQPLKYDPKLRDVLERNADPPTR